ncbi:hypothetical protein GTR04_5789 [Trichophyton interdigitale]|nr:hypothetical protein GY631_5698 [Trichophyton interdigitale]KAG8206827.1 hypothetical protein GTR04_5789 [Trichophyton interdigitale]
MIVIAIVITTTTTTTTPVSVMRRAVAAGSTEAGLHELRESHQRTNPRSKRKKKPDLLQISRYEPSNLPQ